MAMGSSGSHKLNSDKSDGRKYEEVALEMDTPETERWFTENIKKKECAHFVSRSDPSDDREEVCCCGNAKRQHKHENARHTEPEWIPEKHIKEMPTDAFGDLTFKGPEFKKAKYVRASDSTSLEVLYKMMTDKWKLKKPKLVISIAGGAENFYMHPRLKNLFSKGLLKAARSTGAWIFTAGCHAGVAKLVGEAMRDFSRSGRGYHEIVTIGIAPWGTIHNRDMLIRKGEDHPALYHLDVNDQGGHLSLDDNHSHFILVDDGTQGDYWAWMPLRTDLERFISEQGMKEGMNKKIPIVCVVLAGGPTTVDVIHSSLTNETPCVIVEGSGLVADLIARVADTSPPSLDLIKDKLRSLFPDKSEEKKISTYAEKIQDIVRGRHLLTIFREDKGSTRYLDVTMALLKASQRMDDNNQAYQLKLALLWNRLDIAKNDIFNSDWKWKPEDLSRDITDALIEKKPKFVQLFLDQGVRLRDYVTEENLTDLYEKIKPTPSFCQKLKKMQKKKKKDQDGNQKGVDRSQVKVALKSLCRFTDSLYSPTEEQKSTPQSTPLTNSQPLPTIEYLIRDLLIWAVIQNRGELAEIIWTECKDCVVGALACSMIFRALSKQEKDTNNAEEMKVLADQFDERASGVFSECCTKDEGRAEQLLELKSFGWGNSTCMELAANAKAMNFMSNGGVQNYLNKMWYGKLSESNSPFRLFICMVLFPLICTGFITFRENTEGEKDHTRRKCQEAQVKGDSSTDESGSKSTQEESGTLGPLQRLRAFFAAPVVIFCLNVGSHIGFLLLFAYVLLMDFQPTPSWREYLLYVWVSSLLVEEVRQLFQDLKGTEFWFCYYIRNFWNQMDVVAIFLFIVGFVCRWSTATFYARVILAVDFIVFCLRLIDNFTVNRSMGPKIITVQKMIKDFCFFLLLLAVWVVSFGVSKQAILVHNEHRLDWIIRNVLYEPYFTLFGQIPPDVDKLNFNNSTCTSDGSDASLPKCAEARDGVPIVPEVQTMVLLFVYLLFTIILPLNLLIAMFSHTFSEVQDNTDQFWKFQRHKLITEYSKRPPIPPPLILFNHMCRLGKCLVKKCLRVKCKNCDAGQKLDGNNITGLESDKNNITALLYWEEEMKKKYLFNQRNGQNQSSDKKRRGTSNKIDPVVKLIELEKNVRAIEQRLIRQEEKVSQVSQVSQCTMALDWIMKSLTEKGLASEEKAPVMESSRPQTH